MNTSVTWTAAAWGHEILRGGHNAVAGEMWCTLNAKQETTRVFDRTKVHRRYSSTTESNPKLGEVSCQPRIYGW